MHNGILKLSHTKPCNKEALRDSLATPLQGFVLLLSQTITMKKLAYSAVLALLLIPSLTFASFDTSLKYGMKGQAVSDLQDFLADQNVYTGKVDGRFGLGTLKAVESFQTANNLSADGYFGLKSQAVANTLLSAELAPSNAAEQAETGTIAPVATVDGCTSTSGFSITTGHACDGSTPIIQSNIQTFNSPVQQQVVIPTVVNQPTTVSNTDQLSETNSSLQSIDTTIPCQTQLQNLRDEINLLRHTAAMEEGGYLTGSIASRGEAMAEKIGLQEEQDESPLDTQLQSLTQSCPQ